MHCLARAVSSNSSVMTRVSTRLFRGSNGTERVQQNSSLLPPPDHGQNTKTTVHKLPLSPPQPLSASAQALLQLVLHLHDVLPLVAAVPLSL